MYGCIYVYIFVCLYVKHLLRMYVCLILHILVYIWTYACTYQSAFMYYFITSNINRYILQFIKFVRVIEYAYIKVNTASAYVYSHIYTNCYRHKCMYHNSCISHFSLIMHFYLKSAYIYVVNIRKNKITKQIKILN